MGTTWLIAGLFVLLPLVVVAQSCGDHDIIDAQLHEIYGETHIWSGFLDPRVPYMIEMHLQVEGGSWTIMKVYPNRTACILEVGRGWGVSMSEGKEASL